MIVLDTNETILSPRNIRECKTKEQLILYLKLNLLGQALNKGKILQGYSLTITDEEEKEYTLNIGTINNNNVEDKILISFRLENVIQYFSTKKEGKYELNYNINFENIIISSVLCIENINFNGSVYFRNTTLQSNVGFYNSNFNKLLVFSNSNFYQRLPLEFDNIEFNNMLSFADSEFKCRVEIKNSKFNGVSFFAGNTFNYILLFRECELNNIICFYTSNFKLNLKFVNTAINRVIYFRGSTINELTFNEVKFNDNSILSIDNNFIENNFYDGLFNSLLNKKKLKNKNNEINKMYFYNIRIIGKIELKNIEVNETDFKGSIIDGGLINPVNFKVNKFANRESALFLKQQAYARNNAIDALQYKAKEIECHKNDLMKSAKDIIQNKEYSFTKKTKELYKIVGDIASIYLSSLYSDNGQNWIRAFICTILFPSVFFTLSYNIYNIPIFIFVLISFLFIPLCDNTKITKYIFISMFTYLILFIPIQNYIFSILIDIDNKTFIKELLSYITPTNFNQIILDKTNESYIYKDNTIIRAINYFLGKIAFWYGSVQTVQAFRKFAKGA